MWSRLREVFSVDLRTLALLRINLAVLILVDLVYRSINLKNHYTDWGMLPREALLQISGWRMSLHLAVGSTAGQALLFLIAGVFAVALLVGYRTRLMTFLSWLMLMSLHSRNPIVLHGGDLLLLLLVFWSLFLPLGARFSIDAALDKSEARPSNRHFSAATVALLVQVMSVYFFTALLKTSPVWLPDGTAVELAMRIDHITNGLAVWFRDFHALQRALTYYVLGLELVAPLLMFAPLLFPWIRLAGMGLLIAMHIGFFVFLNIGLFPAVSIVSLLTFTPALIWDRLAARWRTRERSGLKIYYDKDCGFCLKTCRMLREFLLFREIPILPAQDYPDVYPVMQQHNSWVVVDHDGSQRVRFPALALLFERSPIFHPFAGTMNAKWMAPAGERFYAWVARNRGRLGDHTAVWLPWRDNSLQLAWPAQVVVAALAGIVLWTNLSWVPQTSVPVPKSLIAIRDALGLKQKWNMFAPFPMRKEGWYVVRGETAAGAAVDVLRRSPGEPDWTRPARLASEYPNYRWRKFLTQVFLPAKEKYRPPYAEYLCRSWNRQMGKGLQLTRVQIYFNEETVTLDPGPRSAVRRLLIDYRCKGQHEPVDATLEQEPN